MSGLLTKNPCVDVCEFKKKVCKACGRTKAEDKNWKHLSHREKHAVWMRIMDSHGQGDKKKARLLRARYEKALKSARPAE